MTTMTHPPDVAVRVYGGVDMHKDVHVAAALDELGRLLGTGSFSTTVDGYRQLSRWLRSWGEVVAVGVEGTGSWGAGLARHLTGQGVDVREVMRPNRQHRRRYGKSDEADAIGAARAVLAGEAVGTPKAGTGHVEAIRLLRIARRSAMKARTQAGNQIHAVLDTAPDQLRRRFAGRSTASIVTEAALFRRRQAPTTPLEAARLSLRTLARRWEYLDGELVALDAQLDELTALTAPTLRAINGVGTQVPLLCWLPPATTRTGCAHHPRSPPSAAYPRSTPRPDGNNTTDSTATATATPTGRSTSSSSAGSAGTSPPRLHGPTPRGRPHPQDDRPLPQTTPRPRGLPRDHHRPRTPTRRQPATTDRCLTSREASASDVRALSGSRGFPTGADWLYLASGGQRRKIS